MSAVTGSTPLIGLDVVLLSDLRRAVTKQLSRKVGASSPVDDGGDCSPERVRGNALDARLIHDGAQPPTHVIGGQRGLVPGEEDEVIRPLIGDLDQPGAQDLGGERRNRDRSR
jgi:hypothetical protein